MTQKELLYVEDAVEHEKVIVDIINESINGTIEDDIVSFLNNEIEKHNSIKQRLTNLLEDKSNE